MTDQSAPKHCETLLSNVSLATFSDNGEAYGAITDAQLALADGRILFAGPTADAPDWQAAETIDCRGQWITPGLIDCHTHLIFGGNRAREFELRLKGASYEEIAASGGGINNTVQQTRAASKEVLMQSAQQRLSRLLAEGVTTVEIKSGYGLTLESERRMLEVARDLAATLPVTVSTTFLGAHALPVEFQSLGKDAYIDQLCDDMLPALNNLGLIDAVDVFCEGIGFSPQQCTRVFKKSAELGLSIKAHVEQLSDLNGAKLAAEHGARSVDHLEYLSADAIPTLKAAGTVAVLLPGAFYFLGETRKPPVEALREADIPMAVATDLNPGSSPQASLLLALNQAAVLFGMTPEECLRGATVNAAQALGLQKHKGQLAPGFDADIVLWDIEHPAELVYGVNFHQPSAIWQAGKHVTSGAG